MAHASSPVAIALRAAPRLLLMTVLAVGALTSDRDWLRILAAVLLVVNVVRLLSPGWRHWVRTGERPPDAWAIAPAGAKPDEPGSPTERP